MNNLHISLNGFTHANRVLKIIRSLINFELIDQVYVAALYNPGLLEDEIYVPGIEVKRFNLKTRKMSKLLIAQLFKYFEFLYSISKYYKNKKIRLINIHSLALLPIGVYLKKKFDAKLVYDTHELETETNGLFGLRKRLSKIVERSFIKRVDLVVVVGDLIADWYVGHYGIQRPYVVKNIPRYRGKIENNNKFRNSLNIPSEKIIFLYQGGFMAGRGIELLLETFKKSSIQDAVIIFMGYGLMENKIKEASEKYNSIYYLPAVPIDEILEYTCSADFGLAIIEFSCLSYYYSLPNKLFEYLVAEIPVVVSNMKEMAKIVIENEVGVVVENLTTKGIEDAINKLLDMNYSELKENIARTKKKYCWEAQETMLVSAYQKLLSNEEGIVQEV
jgi:glycosyltransferase involved in cell wall biosynthesis